jgi:hypothetical protein
VRLAEYKNFSVIYMRYPNQKSASATNTFAYQSNSVLTLIQITNIVKCYSVICFRSIRYAKIKLFYSNKRSSLFCVIPELLLGELFGAGVFVTTVVAGSICIAKPFKLMERPFLRDVVFYLFAGFWAFYIFYR